MHHPGIARFLGAAVLAAAASAACAQGDYPSRSIEFVIPLPPGGPTDAAPRIALNYLAPILKVPLVAVNKPGAGGGIAAEYVAKSKADGYTVFATSNPTLTVRPVVEKSVPYAMSDFIAIGSYATDVGVIATAKSAGLANLDALVDYARKNPGKLSYASAGVGSVSHFSAELFKQAYGIDIVHVPYPGSGPARTAILGGHVPAVSAAYSAFSALFQSGDLVPQITTASKRLAALPDVPTMAEKGFGAATLNIWMGFFVPAGTPAPVVDTLSRALAQAARDPGMTAALEKGGMVAEYRDGEATRRQMELEFATVRKAAEKIDFQK
jgi:tripartite-type tricarboxylate transporter receptor subunit TctC